MNCTRELFQKFPTQPHGVGCLNLCVAPAKVADSSLTAGPPGRKFYGVVDKTKAVTLVPFGTTSRPSPAARPVY
jgi:hypothetical protein